MEHEESRATPGQRLLWMMDHYRGGNGMMSVPLLYRMRGPLDLPALQSSLDRLVDRHEALRTTFDRKRRQLVQCFRGHRHVEIELVDLPVGEDPADLARGLLRRDLDTTTGVLRAFLIQVAPEDHLFVLDIHHLVTDAWSNRLISRDLAHFYNRRHLTAQEEPPPVNWQYSDYTRWHERRLTGERLARHQDYWRRRLSAAEFPRTLPVPERSGRLRPLAANTWFRLEPDILERLQAVARRERTTRYVLLFSVFFMTMNAVNGQRDLTIGSIFANRAAREVQETVGYFANLVPIRAEAAPVPDAGTVIRSVRKAVLEAMEHEEFPYLTLPGLSGRQQEGRPDDVVFHMLAVPPTARFVEPEFAGLTVRSLHIPDGLGSRFDLELLILPSSTGLEGVFRYAADRFDESYVDSLASTYRRIAAQIASTGD